MASVKHGNAFINWQLSIAGDAGVVFDGSSAVMFEAELSVRRGGPAQHGAGPPPFISRLSAAWLLGLG